MLNLRRAARLAFETIVDEGAHAVVPMAVVRGVDGEFADAVGNRDAVAR